jgi:hypothetical protein
MAADIANEIQQMLIKAWGNFCDYYDKEVPEYIKSLEDTENYWICWNEYDLLFHIGRFFYDILSKNKEYSNIAIHFEKNVNDTNFKGYKFKDKLGDLKKKLDMKKGPKVDLIIVDESSDESFLLCAEVKYFHGPSERYGKKPTEKIHEDIKKLKEIRDCEVAKRVVFMLFDDYYWNTKKETADDIKHELERIKKDEGIEVLFHSSEAKMFR